MGLLQLGLRDWVSCTILPPPPILLPGCQCTETETDLEFSTRPDSIGLGSGLATNDSWATAFDTSTGALMVSAFQPLQAFGRFCGVIMALGLISNSVPGTYSATMCAQILGRHFQVIPRWLWTCVLAMIELSLGLGGRNSLYVILSNFLALMVSGFEI